MTVACPICDPSTLTRDQQIDLIEAQLLVLLSAVRKLRDEPIDAEKPDHDDNPSS
ncbi:hypothetical protein [Metapseudomonas lalkuanensis]|uniref:hypothetical protein n=1 Tax=Metapseudomonas lalkuanensis TaxID=2604832 RepID=UPI0015B42A94|nr:hypothetical protein [Pseudomonas lalkuanensis]